MINWGYTQLCLQGGVRFIWINYLFSFSVWSIMLCPNNYTLQFFSSRGFCFFCTFTMSWGDNCNFLKVIKFLGFKICTLSLHSEIPVVCCYWKWYSTRFSMLLQVGFFSGRKRESIFKSPDDPNGKVGVTNSGKGLTDFQRREKYLQLKGANIDNEDQE